MQHTTLGRTGLDTSAVGIGLEYMHGQPRGTVASIIRQAALGLSMHRMRRLRASLSSRRRRGGENERGSHVVRGCQRI